MTVIYSDEYIEILKDSGNFYLKLLNKGISVEWLKKIVSNISPAIKITNPNVFKDLLSGSIGETQPLGIEQKRVNIRISNDELSAFFTLFVPEADLLANNRANLAKEIFVALNRAGVVYGINTKVLTGPLKAGTEYLIAEGTAPINGEDAEVKMYELKELQPKIIESGNVNHYELNLIDCVNEGDWLGERKDPTLGTPGKTVKGREIPAVPGRNLPLSYDRVSVRESYKDGVTTLYSRKNGAVYYKGDTIGVYDFLEIKGDIDFSTGNINFDGFLSVKGTVADNFNVVANKDVEILGEYGVGAAESITSNEGNIYIKGGIAGKNKAVIRCKKNLYVKFLSDVTIECDGSVYVGFYCINSNIRAKQVIVESPKGRITGGRIEAEFKVSAAEIGNRSESRTVIRVKGFDRSALKLQLDTIIEDIEKTKKDINSIKQNLQYHSSGKMSEEQRNTYERLKNRYDELKNSLKELEYKYKSINEYLRTPGEGAIIAKTKIYPKVRVEIRGAGEEIVEEKTMTTYYYSESELKTM